MSSIDDARTRRARPVSARTTAGTVDEAGSSAAQDSADGRRLVAAARHAATMDAQRLSAGDPPPRTFQVDVGTGVGTDTPTAGNVDAGRDDGQLGRLLGSMPLIEQAKGIVMGYYGLTGDGAYAVLRRWSGTTNVKLVTLSAQLVAVTAQPGTEPFAGLRAFVDALETVDILRTGQTGRTGAGDRRPAAASDRPQQVRTSGSSNP